MSVTTRVRSSAAMAIMIGGLALGGCRAVNTAERADPMATPDPVLLKKVETDITLRAGVRIVSANQGVVSGNLLKVQVVVQNNKSAAKSFNYKWEWYDQDGMVVDSPTTRLWQVGRIQAKDQLTLTGVAPNPRVVDFRLKLIENR